MDHAATTPVDHRVIEAMLPYFSDQFGNPGSLHFWGQRAEIALDRARQEIAEILGCEFDEIIFTSGGSESNSLALFGSAIEARHRSGANQILTTPVEHPSIIQTARNLEGQHGFDLVMIPVDKYGVVSLEDFNKLLSKDVALVSVMYANNEVGSINPIQEIGEVCRESGIPLHVDALQAANHLDISVDNLAVDLFSLGAHKFYGPKGVGVLYVRNSTPIHPIQLGGSQEFNRRAGTQNIPLIVGFAEALKIAETEKGVVTSRCASLQKMLIHETLERIEDVNLTGHPDKRLANHASFVFRDIDSNSLLSGLDIAGFACSSGSACKVGDAKASDVLAALDIPEEWSLGALRVTIGRSTTEASVRRFLDVLPPLVERLRQAARNPDVRT
jgi:cysteine desulfurase